MARLTFHGAAETVTGSKYLIEAEAARVLCTTATDDLAELILFDSAKNQERDADYANRKGFSKHKPALPLYESGDVGRYDAPLYHDPSPPPECDVLICESIDCDHAADHDLSEGELSGAACVLDGRNVHLARSVAESKAINDVDGPAVVISSAGMMTGGRILHHLKRRLPDENNTIVLGGFMAAGTRGRRLQDGAKTLRIHGRDVPVKAAIDCISGLSGHAGRSELLRWLKPLPDPKVVFLTHGEPDSAAALAQELKTSRGWNVVVPKLGESFELTAEGIS